MPTGSKHLSVVRGQPDSSHRRTRKGILEVRDEEFDADPDIFNVGNGVVT